MVKLSEIEELIRMLNTLSITIRRNELVKSGKWRTINPISGEEIEIPIKEEEITKIQNDLANILKLISDKIKNIDWSKVE
ncbi:MAG: hypothetical protein QXI49_05365 [Candidatus Methanomethylicaceae archaeon]